MTEEFAIVREEWNRYKLLPDNIDLRVKVPLAGITVIEDKARYSNFRKS